MTKLATLRTVVPSMIFFCKLLSPLPKLVPFADIGPPCQKFVPQLVTIFSALVPFSDVCPAEAILPSQKYSNFLKYAFAANFCQLCAADSLYSKAFLIRTYFLVVSTTGVSYMRHVARQDYFRDLRYCHQYKGLMLPKNNIFTEFGNTTKP